MAVSRRTHRWAAIPLIIATLLAVALLSAPAHAEAKTKEPPPRAHAAGVRCDLATLSCGWKFNRRQSVDLVHAARAGGMAAAGAACSAITGLTIPCSAVAAAVYVFVQRGGTIPPDKYLFVGISVGREPIAKFVD
jgi:hypothetical protein